jgi:hypothetical protein
MTPTTSPASMAETLPVEPFGYVSMTAVRQGRQGSFLGTFVETHDSVPIYRGDALYALRRTVDQLRAELAALKAVAPAAGLVVGWQPIDTAPATGYFLVCDEDGESIRTKLRLDGEWHDVEYPFIEHAPWGDKSVGSDALRILRLAQADPMCPMKLGVSDGCPEPAFWCQIPKFDAARLHQAAQKEGE